MKNWIKAPVQISRNEFLALEPVRVMNRDLPASARRHDQAGHPLQRSDGDSVYGYFIIAESPEQLAKRSAADIHVQLEGLVFSPSDGHVECDSAGIAAEGNLYAISFEDFRDIAGARGVPGAYRLDTIGREAEDPYRQFAR